MTLKMKELEARTGVNREAIRFYIREGLLPEPEKPKRNVALYTEEHVERTRLIKELQEKHFLPLKKVKQVLDSPDARALAEDRRAPGMSHFLPAMLRDTTPGPDRSIQELSDASGLSRVEIDELVENGTVSATSEGLIDFRDAAILETWGRAKARGYDASHGYDAEFLGRYALLMRELAKQETAQFLEHFEASLDGRAAGEMAAEGVEIANLLLTLLHSKYLLQEVDEQTRP
jgi:DNA-binding transcriptional MerR regulator